MLSPWSFLRSKARCSQFLDMMWKTSKTKVPGRFFPQSRRPECDCPSCPPAQSRRLSKPSPRDALADELNGVKEAPKGAAPVLVVWGSSEARGPKRERPREMARPSQPFEAFVPAEQLLVLRAPFRPFRAPVFPLRKNWALSPASNRQTPA